MQVEHEELLTAIASATVENAEELSPQDLANTSWSFATLARVDEQFLSAIEDASLKALEKLGPLELSAIMWSYAALLVRSHSLLLALSSEALSRAGEFASQAISNTVWSCATLMWQDEILLATLLQRSRAAMRSFSSQALANTAWSLAVLNVSVDSTSADILEASIAEKMSAFRPLELANVAWAFSAIRLGDQPLLKTLAAAAQKHLRGGEMDVLLGGMVLEGLARAEELELAFAHLACMQASKVHPGALGIGALLSELEKGSPSPTREILLFEHILGEEGLPRDAAAAAVAMRLAAATGLIMAGEDACRHGSFSFATHARACGGDPESAILNRVLIASGGIQQQGVIR